MSDEWLKLIVEEIKVDIRRVEKKVDSMLAFKWQLIGGGVVVSTIVGICVQFLIR
jgi:hypothetical protein